MRRSIGAEYTNEGVNFSVWAPEVEQVIAEIISPVKNFIPLKKDDRGYWSTRVIGLPPGACYYYRLKDQQRPDPASQSQPEGVHGPSRVVEHGTFPWTDQSWQGRTLRDMVLYELHVGTFSPE